jgi:hypothetical protein
MGLLPTQCRRKTAKFAISIAGLGIICQYYFHGLHHWVYKILIKLPEDAPTKDY